MSLDSSKYLRTLDNAQSQNQSQSQRVAAKFHSLPVNEELEALWREVSLLHEMIEKVLEIAEWEHKIDYDKVTGDTIILEKDDDNKQQHQQQSCGSGNLNPYG
jgi:hypothetical protein